MSRWCLVGVFVMGLATGPLLYVSTVVEDEDAFVATTDLVLDQPDVRRFVADEATALAFEAVEADELVAELLPGGVRTFAVPVTRIATEQLTNAAFDLLDTDAVTRARDAALRELHSEVTADSETVAIDLRAVLVRTAREVGGPTVGAGVAKAVSGTDAGRFVLAEPGSDQGRLLEVVRAVPAIGGLAALVLVLLMVATVVLSLDRRQALTRVGVTSAGAALVSVVVVAVVLAAVMGSSDVGAAVVDVISADFAAQQRGVIVNGAVLALIGLLLGRRPAAVALRRLPVQLWRRSDETASTVATMIGDNPPFARIVVWAASVFALVSWTSPTMRVVLTIVVLTLVLQVGIGVFTDPNERFTGWRRSIGAPEPLARVDAGRRVRVNLAVIWIAGILVWPSWSAAGLVVVFVVGALLQIVVDVGPARRSAGASAAILSADADEGVPDGVSGRWRLAAAIATVLAVVGGIALTIGSAATTEAAAGCNGHVELCDRRVDEVVFAGSHNAMSSIDLGWDLAMQTGDMVSQLDHGIRSLLIDALYWDDSGTLEGGNDPAASAVIEAALSDDSPRPGTWLCHGFCALGAMDLTSGLASIDAWLDAHPREVLVIIVQDEVRSGDLEAAFRDSGLLDRAYVRRSQEPWPTLGTMIDAGRQVLVYAENGGEPDTWLQNGYADTFTETPFTFALRSDFSCDPNRGEPGHPLFLLNHWLTTGIPVREVAAAVNSRDALLERVRECEGELGRLPTVLATDFVQTGDLVAVVDELNGID